MRFKQERALRRAVEAGALIDVGEREAQHERHTVMSNGTQRVRVNRSDYD